jgi:hypothetical protein
MSKTWQDDCIVERIYHQTGTTQRPGGQQAGIPASAFCNRVVAPFITGSNDPLVAATYCKEGK